MKKILLIAALFFVCKVTNAQFMDYTASNQGNFTGGAGVTWIDGRPYSSIRLRPEIAFSKIGIGLDFNLEFDANGNINKENFNEASDYLSIIRYVRYGNKSESFYARLGALDYATLGHGSIMYMYNNSPSYDVRKIGLEFDIDMEKFGFESVYGNFGDAGVAGFRGFVRPLKLTALGDIPVLGNLETGVTFAGDFNKYAGVSSASLDSLNQVKIHKDYGVMQVMGFDVGLPVSLSDYFRITPYYDFAKIVNFGQGSSAGIMLNLNGLGIFSAGAKLERRFNGDRYLPSYFNSFYEVERLQMASKGANSNYISKAQRLDSLTTNGSGFYGGLLLKILNIFEINGSYQRLDNDPESGILHLGTDISPAGAPYIARAGYDKVRIGNEKDIFTLDDRSYLFAEVGYKPFPFMIVSLVYNWTFTPNRDKDNNVIEFVPQKKIESRVSFVYPFNF